MALPDYAIENQVKQLFEKNSIEKIRIIQQNTRQDIEKKKQELRRLVGNRYRDLIDSADSILAMRDASLKLYKTTSTIEEECSTMTHKLNVSSKVQTEEERNIKRKKYLLATQIKFLVDIPEKIWSALEDTTANFFKATCLFLEAEGVYNNLSKIKDSSKDLSSFPLLFRQWVTIEQFPSKIKQTSRSHLLKNGLSPEDHASALSALVLLDKLTPLAALDEYLRRRQQALEQLLAPKKQLGQGQGQALNISLRISTQVASLLSSLQQTLLHVTLLFAKPPSPLLSRYLNEESLAKEILPLAGGVSFEGPPHLQDPSWRGVAPVPLSLFQKRVQDWLNNLLSIFGSSLPSLLQAIDSPTQLASLQRRLNSLLVSPSSAVWNLTTNLLVPLFDEDGERDGQIANDNQLQDVEAKGAGEWREVQSLLTTPSFIEIWRPLQRNLFLARSKQLIAKRVDELISNFRSAVVSALEPAPSSSSGGPVSSGPSFIISGKSQPLGSNSPSSARGRPSQVGEFVWKDADDSVDLSRTKVTGLSPEVGEVVHVLDKLLSSAADDLKLLLQPLRATTPSASSSTPLGSSWRKPSTLDGRSFKTLAGWDSSSSSLDSSEVGTELRAYFKEKVAVALKTLVEDVEVSIMAPVQATVLSSLPPPGTLAFSASTFYSHENFLTNKGKEASIERVVLVARIWNGLLSSSEELPTTLEVPQPSTSPFARSTPRLPSSTPGKVPSTTPRFGKGGVESGSVQILYQTLEKHYLKNYMIWADWASHLLAYSLYQNVAFDDWSSPFRSKVWEEIVIKVEGEGGEIAEETLKLPRQASPYLVSFLFTACQQIFSLGGHCLPHGVIQYLERKLTEKLAHIYESFFLDPSAAFSTGSLLSSGGTALSTSGSNSTLLLPRSTRVNKDGNIQLLFDLRFALDVLRGRSIAGCLPFFTGPPEASPILPRDHQAIKEGVESDKMRVVGEGLDEVGRWEDGVRRSADDEQWERNLFRLQAGIEGRLDPIDIQFYDPHLKTSVSRYYLGSSSLLGSLTQLSPLYSNLKPKVSIQEQHNLLGLAPVVPRFSYLPISTQAPSTPTPKSSPSSSLPALATSPTMPTVINSPPTATAKVEAEAGFSSYLPLKQFSFGFSWK